MKYGDDLPKSRHQPAYGFTTEIRHVLIDNSWIYDYHTFNLAVQTRKEGKKWVTAILGLDAATARKALYGYAVEHPEVELKEREYDGFLKVVRPVKD